MRGTAVIAIDMFNSFNTEDPTLQRTWPHGSSIGGLAGELCSLETGQEKTERKTNSWPSSSSTGSCSPDARSWSFSRPASLSSVGRATEPAAVATSRGLSLACDDVADADPLVLHERQSLLPAYACTTVHSDPALANCKLAGRFGC